MDEKRTLGAIRFGVQTTVRGYFTWLKRRNCQLSARYCDPIRYFQIFNDTAENSDRNAVGVEHAENDSLATVVLLLLRKEIRSLVVFWAITGRTKHGREHNF